MSEDEVMQDAATTVETPTETESAPVETNTVEPQEAPVVSNDTEDDDSKPVPYKRFKEVNDKYRDLESKVSQIIQNQAPQEQYVPPTADPDTDSYVDYRAEQKARAIIEANERAKFESKHAKTFEKDPLLRAAFMLEAQNVMAKGQYVDRDAVLEQAKSALDARLRPAQDAAKQEGVREGQDIAKTKQQLGAVGETGKAPETSDDNLTAAEMAKKYNLPVSH